MWKVLCIRWQPEMGFALRHNVIEALAYVLPAWKWSPAAIRMPVSTMLYREEKSRVKAKEKERRLRAALRG